MTLQAQATSYNNIVVLYDPSLRPFFFRIVQDALDVIYSRPLGKKMIDDLTRGKATLRTRPPQTSYVVAIMPPDEIRPDTTPGGADFTPGNRVKRVNEIAGMYFDGPRSADHQGKTPGTASAVTWNPNVIQTPDGARPPFIGLAHELVHCWRNVHGLGCRSSQREEQETTGLVIHSSEIDENALRREHDIPARLSYGTIQHECSYLTAMIE